jgi:hypothetical protein
MMGGILKKRDSTDMVQELEKLRIAEETCETKSQIL